MAPIDDLKLVLEKADEMMELGRVLGIEAQLRRFQDVTMSVRGRVDALTAIGATVLGWSSDKDLLSIFPIVGMPGMGKTTVAKMVYADNRVKEHFGLRIWVRVSPFFNPESVLRRIAEAMSSKYSDDSAVHEHCITDLLMKRIRGERYLLVLDDVWNEDENKWARLKHQLLTLAEVGGQRGSTVIVTTRSHCAARMMFMDVGPYELQGLAMDACSQLLSKLIHEFGQEELKFAQDLKERCCGVPIAVHDLAQHIRTCRLLAEKLDRNFNFMKDNSLVFRFFSMSYELFPIYLRNCFNFCALFPQGHVYDMEELCEIWFAERYAPPSIWNHPAKATQPEQLSHFAKLWNECFIAKSKRSSGRGKPGYKMHYLMHQLVREITDGRLATNRQGVYGRMTTGANRQFFPSERNIQNCLHLSMFVDPETSEFPRVDFSLKNLKTLIIVREAQMVESDRKCEISKIPSSMLARLKSLCVLDLQFTMIKKLPHTIEKLLNLRYLNLSETDIAFLPQSVSKLQSLMFLKLVNCIYLRKLHGWFSLNSDGSFIGSSVEGGAGYVIRSHLGTFVCAGTKYSIYQSALEAETWGLRIGLLRCKECELQNVRIQSDSINLVRILKKDAPCSWRIRNLMLDCWNFILSF